MSTSRRLSAFRSVRYRRFDCTHSTLLHSLNGHSLLRITAITTSGSRARGEPGTGACAPLSRDLFNPALALSLALLRMRARMSARVAARTCVGGDPTNANLYCVYALVGGANSCEPVNNTSWLAHFSGIYIYIYITRYTHQRRCLAQNVLFLLLL